MLLDYELAAQWRGINPNDWESMSTERQAYYIAVYRIQKQIAAIQAYEHHRDVQRKGRA